MNLQKYFKEVKDLGQMVVEYCGKIGSSSILVKDYYSDKIVDT